MIQVIISLSFQFKNVARDKLSFGKLLINNKFNVLIDV
jgi:hypothetical protein